MISPGKRRDGTLASGMVSEVGAREAGLFSRPPVSHVVDFCREGERLWT